MLGRRAGFPFVLILCVFAPFYPGKAESINLVAAIFCCLFVLFVSAHGQLKCIPDDVNADDFAVVNGVPTKAKEPSEKRPTVKDQLNAIGARCLRQKLIDRRGRQVKFYLLKGCWGNPPADYLEILDRQRDELKRMRKRYTVIEISCDGKIDPSRVS